MNFPDLQVQVAFTTDPLTRPGGGAWTNVATSSTPARESVRIERGADMKTQDIEPGTLSVVLDNADRDFDPSNTAGAHYPNVKPRRRIRVMDNGTSTVLFTGFVERWPVRWSGSDSWVAIDAADLLSLFADESLPSSIHDYVVRQNATLHYWPLTENFGIGAADLLGSASGSYAREVAPSEVTLPPYTPDPAQSFHVNGDAIEAQNMTVTGITIARPYYVACWYQYVDAGGAEESTLDIWELNVADQSERLYIDFTNGWLVYQQSDAGGSISTRWLSGPVLDYRPHHIIVDRNTQTLYVDGVLQPSEGGAASGSLTLVDLDNATFRVGPEPVAIGAVSEPSIHAIAHVTFLDGGYDAVELYESGAVAWSGDTTSERLIRVLDILGVDAGDRDISSGVEICGPTILNGQNVLEYLRKIAATERGPLFVSGDGKVTFPGQLANDPAITATFDDEESVGSIQWADIALDYSLDRVINTARVQREGGITQVETDAASIATYGVLDGGLGVLQTLHRDPSGARGLAASLVVRGADPRTIIYSLDIDATDTSFEAADLALTLGDAARVLAQPPGGGAQIDQTCFIERISMTLTDDLRFDITFGLYEYVTLPDFAWNTADQGWDESAWA